jgi:multiple sugar transport system permease protein
MLVPAMAFFVLSFAVPLVIVLRLSLLESDYVITTFVGLQNYSKAVVDPYFLKAFGNGMVFVVLIAPALLVVSYSIASFLSDFRERTQSIARFVLFIPGLASGVIITLLWRWLLQKAGLLNTALAAVGLPIVGWLTEAWPARIAVAMVSLTSGIGGTVILFAASMHSIPTELREAALVDGAGSRSYKRFIVRPIMASTIALCLLLNIVGILQTWEVIYVLTGEGGPQWSTATPVYDIFMTAFRFNKQGYAAAKGVILMLVIAGILAVKQRAEKAWLR